jgi:hypothetical protein
VATDSQDFIVRDILGWPITPGALVAFPQMGEGLSVGKVVSAGPPLVVQRVTYDADGRRRGTKEERKVPPFMAVVVHR